MAKTKTEARDATSKRSLKKSRKTKQTLKTFVRRYVKETENPAVAKASLSGKTTAVIVHMLDGVIDRISEEASRLLTARQKKTLGPRELAVAARLVFPGNSVSDEMISYGMTAVNAFDSRKDRGIAKAAEGAEDDE